MDKKYGPLFWVVVAYSALVVILFAAKVGPVHAFAAQATLLKVGSSILAMIFLTVASLNFDPGEKPRQIWGLLAVSALFNVIAESITGYYIIYRGLDQLPLFTAADIFWLVSYVPLVWAVIVFVRGWRGLGLHIKRRPLWFAAAAVVGISIFAGFQLYGPLISGDASPSFILFNVSYALLDTAFLAVALLLSLTIRGEQGLPFKMLGAGFLCIVVSDLTTSWMVLEQQKFTGNGFDILAIAGNLLVALAAYFVMTPVHRVKAQKRREMYRLSSLNRMARTISGLLEPDLIAAAVLPSLEAILGPDFVRLAVYHQDVVTCYDEAGCCSDAWELDQRGLELLTAINPDGDGQFPAKISPTDRFLLPALLKGSISANNVFFQLVLSQIMGYTVVADLAQSGMRYFLFSPFQGRSGVNGCLLTAWRRSPRIDDYAVESVKSVCEFLGLSMQNALDYENLLAAKQESEHAKGLMSDMINLVSHELRHPLTILGGYASTLLAYGADLETGKTEQILASMLRSVDRLTVLSDELVWASRIQGGSLPLQIDLVNLEKLVRELADDLSGGAGMRFRFDFPEVPPIIVTDPNKLRVVLQNLYTNALHFSDPTGFIDVGARVSGGEVSVSVTDYGVGIPPDSLNRIFDRFYQVQDAEHHRTGGLGLGLYITRNLVECLGGQIHALSEPGAGATFTFTLPLSLDTPAGVQPVAGS